MSNTERIDTDSYIFLEDSFAIVNQGSSYIIINTLTKEVVSDNVSSFADSVKIINYLLDKTKTQNLGSDLDTVRVLPIESPTISDSDNSLKSRQNDQLDALDLASIRVSSAYFKEMCIKVLQYHLDHGASEEEAGVIARYYLDAADKARNVGNQQDFKDFFKFIQDLRFKVSRYKHKSNDGKYGWAVSLDREVISKLSLMVNRLS